MPGVGAVLGHEGGLGEGDELGLLQHLQLGHEGGLGEGGELGLLQHGVRLGHQVPGDQGSGKVQA